MAVLGFFCRFIFSFFWGWGCNGTKLVKLSSLIGFFLNLKFWEKVIKSSFMGGFQLQMLKAVLKLVASSLDCPFSNFSNTEMNTDLNMLTTS